MWRRRRRTGPQTSLPLDPFDAEETARIVCEEEDRLKVLAQEVAAVIRSAPCLVEAWFVGGRIQLRNTAGRAVVGVDDHDMVRQIEAMASLEQVTVAVQPVHAMLYCTITSDSWRYVFWALPIAAERY